MSPVDVTRAGEGQLEITVDYGAVANTVRPIDKGLFVVSFTPREARPHVVQITFNGEQCKCWYFLISIMCEMFLTPSSPSVPNCYCLKGSAPYWSNPPL